MNSKKIPSLFVELLVSFSIGPIVFNITFCNLILALFCDW